jgi:thymidylate synthase
MLSSFPIVHEKDLMIFDRSRSIAIACMWSLQDKIKEELTTESLTRINLIGNTYSINAPKGIITNLCANGNIRHLIITGDVLCYQSIVDNMIEIFCTDLILPYMDIYRAYLSRVREQILTCQYVNAEDLNKYVECIVAKRKIYDLRFDDKTIRYFENEVIPFTMSAINVKDVIMKVVPSEEYPTNISGYSVHCYDGDLFNTFLDTCQLINTRGYIISDTREISNLSIVCHSIDENSLTKFPHLTPELITQYQTNILCKDCPPNLSYTYGSLINKYIDAITEQLINDKFTRRCFVPIFREEHTSNEQPPCAVFLFFRIVKNKLNLTVSFRSNDMFKAWILNVIAFRTFQKKICELVNVPIGILTTHGCSSHIYNADLINLKCLLKDYVKKSIIPEPEGYYLVDKLDDTDTEIRVRLFTNDHGFVKEWKNWDYESLIEEVSSYINNPQHAAYVAKEITKIHYTKNIV